MGFISNSEGAFQDCTAKAWDWLLAYSRGLANQNQPGVPSPLQSDVEMVGRIEAVPTILEVVCRTTRMGFAAVARVTEDSWIACGVLDEINFGLKPGGELKVETTICHEIRQSHKPVVIDNVPEDVVWCSHATPTMHGFKSYISVPILLGDGTFFGTLCAIDPQPAHVNTPEIIGMFRLFAELIGKHIDAQRKLLEAEAALVEERALSELRVQFVAVLGHDLRAPMRGIRVSADLILRNPPNEQTANWALMIRNSAGRMQGMIGNLLDLARTRLGGGIPLHRDDKEPLEPILRTVIDELSVGSATRVNAAFRLQQRVSCDRGRLAQLFSNILSNAFSYGSPDQPICVEATSIDGRFELSVANGGTPIPASDLSRLFQPFYRSEVSQNGEGLGLGLYIAHEIAKQHGGTLSVESSARETRFTLRMPTS